MEEVTGSSPVSTTSKLNPSQEAFVVLDLNVAATSQIAEHYRSKRQNWVRANMVVSRDGHFVGSTKSSRDLTSTADFKLLLLLRALSDVLLVGANTARIEKYRQPKNRPEFAFLGRRTPRLAIVSASLEFDLGSAMFSGGEEKTIVINVGENLPSPSLCETAHVINLASIVDAPQVDMADRIISCLNEIGLNSITCEGGPSLLSNLLKATVIDEYDLAISPVNVGGIPDWSDALPNSSQWETVGTAIADGFEFRRMLLKSAGISSAGISSAGALA